MLGPFYSVGWGCTPSTRVVTGYVGPKTTPLYTNIGSPYTTCGYVTYYAELPTTSTAPFDQDDPQTFFVGAAGWLKTPPGLGVKCDVWMIDDVKHLVNSNPSL